MEPLHPDMIEMKDSVWAAIIIGSFILFAVQFLLGHWDFLITATQKILVPLCFPNCHWGG